MGQDCLNITYTNNSYLHINTCPILKIFHYEFLKLDLIKAFDIAIWKTMNTYNCGADTTSDYLQYRSYKRIALSYLQDILKNGIKLLNLRLLSLSLSVYLFLAYHLFLLIFCISENKKRQKVYLKSKMVIFEVAGARYAVPREFQAENYRPNTQGNPHTPRLQSCGSGSGYFEVQDTDLYPICGV